MSVAGAIFMSLRPKQWTKNLIVLAPLIFAGDLLRPGLVADELAAFVIFCMLSGAAYIFNDLKDLERDRKHEKKRSRPIASGRLDPNLAGIAGAALAVGSLAASVLISLPFALSALCFFALQLAYTFYLKDQVILDVMTISAGFVVRAIAGAVAISVAISPWLLVCGALLALFLGLAKRRHELILLEAEAHNHRASLGEYSAAFIDEMISAVTSATIVAYALYAFFSPTAARGQYLMLTIPFVVYGLFRYLYLIHLKNLGGNPEEILLTDKPLIIDIVLWLAAVVAALYFR